MCKLTTVSCLFLTLACSSPAHAQVQPRQEPLALQVKNSIDRGVEYLRRTQKNDGSWESDIASVGFPGGCTALAVLALLNCGVPANDPAVSKGLKYLRDLEPEHTYVRALQTMVFAEARKSEDLQRIQQNVKWLLDARVINNGVLQGWGYGKNGINRIGTDNSNSQYALLGLWAGKQSGAAIDDKVWQEIRDYYVRTQSKNGSWFYNNSIPGASLTMTTAGLSGLLIAGMEMNMGPETLRPDPAKCGTYEENPEIGKSLSWIGSRIHFDASYYNLYGIERAGRLSGLRFFGDHDWYREGSQYLVKQQNDDGSWKPTSSPFDRWPVVNTSFALLFLSKGRTPVLISKLVHTEKLPRRGDTDWNNDRNDLRHLTQFAGKELFNNLPLAWQTFDILRAFRAGTAEVKLTLDSLNQNAADLEVLRAKLETLGDADRKKVEQLIKRIEDRMEPALREIISDMLQSPVVYINGHKSPLERIRPIEREVLRKYVDNGGFILAEACCGRPEFDEGFRALANKLWPQSKLADLSAGHPVWTSKFIVTPGDPYKLMGITLGCKTVVIYSPQDMSCQWEANDYKKSGRGDRAFKLGANIIAYATGLEPPQPRLTQFDVSGGRDKADIPRGFFKVAQLKHGGDWQPAPRAMHNLMDHLQRHSKLDVALKTEELTVDSKSVIDFKFIYMHGRGDFSFPADQLKNLRFNLENGGLLFADACCGKPAFDKAFRKFAAELLPGRKLVEVPLDDVLFSKELNGVKLDEQTIKCRTKAPGASEAGLMRSMPPMLEGIKIDNRWVVLYSKYDIGCALERHRSSDCLGYDPDSAFKIAGAAVLYLLKL